MAKTRSQFLQSRTDGGIGPLVLADGRFSVGNVFFVQSTNTNAGDSAGHGQTPDAPFATIDYAVGQCTASQGDVIVVLPGHVETITAAAGLAADIAGITIQGIGVGRQRPRINYTTAVAASLDISAARVTIENLYFTVTGFDNVTAAVNITAADCHIRNCEFELADATNQAALGILATAAATRMRIEGCDFHGTADAGVTNAIQYAATDDVIIRDCHFHGAFASGSGAIQNTAAAKNSWIFANVIQNLTASNTKAMVFHASSTGQISNNRLQILSGTAPITGAAMSWVGANYYAAAVATAGTLI